MLDEPKGFGTSENVIGDLYKPGGRRVLGPTQHATHGAWARIQSGPCPSFRDVFRAEQRYAAQQRRFTGAGGWLRALA